MKKLVIPSALKTEFSTVETIWHSTGETRRVDALLLSWVKYEKQLRRLFSFLVFQHPNFNAASLDSVVMAFADNRNLNPETFISGISKLGVTPISTLLGNSYPQLWKEVVRIKKYRNKLMHGQHTGQNIKSSQLETDVIHVINWISTLAVAAEATFGYDGLRRRTYVAAKTSANLHVQNYPFSTPAQLKTWLSKLQ